MVKYKTEGNNDFSLNHLKCIIELALEKGYTFYTHRDFLGAGCPPEKAFLLKHDVDTNPSSLRGVLETEMSSGRLGSGGVRSTVYVRVCADYNLMSYQVLPMLLEAERNGFEIGLHSNFLEFATINKLDPFHVLSAECDLMRRFFNVTGMSCHRDFNYAHNSLPWLQERWDSVHCKLGLEYEAYDKRIMDNTIYVNEGTKPHLCWRNMTPEEAIETGKSITLLSHPHWWWRNYPFELSNV